MCQIQKYNGNTANCYKMLLLIEYKLSNLILVVNADLIQEASLVKVSLLLLRIKVTNSGQLERCLYTKYK